MTSPEPVSAPRFARVVSAVVFLVVAAAARGAEDGGSFLRWSGRADISAMNFDYREYDDGRLLDRESGGLPGLAFYLTVSRGRWSLGGRLGWQAGMVSYDGQTDTGIPIQTRTRENLLDTSVRIAHRLQDAAGRGTALYGGFGYRYWGRQIRSTVTSGGTPVSGLNEYYRWKYFFFGGETTICRGNRSRWWLDVRVQRPYRPAIEVDQGARYDTVVLDLGARTGWRLALPWEHRLDARTQWILEPSLQAWDVGRSPAVPLRQNGVPVDNRVIYEPRSTTRSLGIAVGLARLF
jgi:hypothetical protein